MGSKVGLASGAAPDVASAEDGEGAMDELTAGLESGLVGKVWKALGLAVTVAMDVVDKGYSTDILHSIA